MSSTATSTDPRPVRPSVLARAEAAMAARTAADVTLVEAAAEWAHSHPAPCPEEAAVWGDRPLPGERAVPLAGPGAPLVAEFAVHELGVVLRLSSEAASSLIGDALDLVHRLPRLWVLVREGRVPLWLARRAAQESRDLAPGAAAHADALLVWQPRRLNPSRVGRLVHEARLYADPDRAAAAEEEALARRGVHLRREGAAPGTTDVVMTLDSPDALAFDATVGMIADSLAALGDCDSTDVRRARAVGVLADPQRALAFTTGTATLDDGLAPPFSGGSGAAAELHLTITDDDLLATADPGARGVAVSDQLGPVLMRRLAAWLAGSRVTVRPVLDLRHDGVVDAHDPPRWMAEAVRLRDPVCVFPGCGRDSRACDLDHIESYQVLEDGGPPGQTRPDALAPLCRRHHRAKTFGGWSYERRPDGSYVWTTPTGRVIRVPPPRRRPRPPR